MAGDLGEDHEEVLGSLPWKILSIHGDDLLLAAGRDGIPQQVVHDGVSHCDDYPEEVEDLGDDDQNHPNPRLLHLESSMQGHC